MGTGIYTSHRYFRGLTVGQWTPGFLGCQSYSVEEALEFCIEYISGMDAIGIPSSMKDEWKCWKLYLVVA